MIKIYGIKNCNSVKKAFDFFGENNIEFEFFDYKKQAPDEKLLKEFIAKFGIEKVLNKKGTSWRKLSEEQQNRAKDENGAIKLMIEKSSMIKRPIIIGEGKFLIGFDEENYRQTLLK